MIIDQNVGKQIALLVVGLVLAILLAFEYTDDLDRVERRLFYRMVLAAFYLNGIAFIYELLGWLG